MSEMVERCARATFFRGGEQDAQMWAHMQPHLREIALEQARAVLEAMRDPTEDMVEAAALCESSLVEDVYREMIDAALK